MNSSVPRIGVFAALMHPRERIQQVSGLGRDRALPSLLGVVSKRFRELNRRRRGKALRTPGGDHE